jgi:hypothetical protein
MYAVGYKVYHHPPVLLMGIHSTGCKCKLINYNEYNLRVYIYISHFYGHVLFCAHYLKAKLCGVPSRAILKLGVPCVKRGCGTRK